MAVHLGYEVKTDRLGLHPAEAQPERKATWEGKRAQHHTLSSHLSLNSNMTTDGNKNILNLSVPVSALKIRHSSACCELHGKKTKQNKRNKN